METVDISWLHLALSFALLIIPLAILRRYKTGLIKKLIIAVLRMSIQLLFVGYYLQYVFELNNPWLNIAWMIVMVVVADYSTLDRSELKVYPLLWPVFISTAVAIGLVVFFTIGVVVQPPSLMEAQYVIPLTGMVLGNCLRSNVIGIHAFYYGVYQQLTRYEFFLTSGASTNEALFPYFRDALKQVVNPTLATMATMGLVSLPGMMTGQILGGSSPLTAIRYQIVIMLAILAGTVLSVYLSILLLNKRFFDRTGNFKPGLLKPGSEG